MSSATCRLLALVLIVASAALHWAYLTHHCPLDLAPDEAHYWDWSRRLDWSYYSKGPLVAWLIRASCGLLGDAMPAVRLPAILCGSLLLVSLYVLTVQVYRSERLALGVVAAALTLPPVWAMSSLMTIDAPYTCLWGWALVLGHQAVFRRSWWAWPLLGLVVGLGILAKYTMVLFLPSLGLFLLASPEYRRQLRQPGFWVMTALAGLLCLPILLWNIQNEWVSFRHVNALAGAGGSFQPLGPLVYVGQQTALLLGFWFLVWLSAMWAYRPIRGLAPVGWASPTDSNGGQCPPYIGERDDDPGRRYLWWLSAPMFAVFLLFSVKTGGGEINWPVTAYLSGMVLAAGWLLERWPAAAAWQRWLLAGGLAGACLLGLGLIGFLHFSERAYPALTRLIGPPTLHRPMPLRRVDPTCRLRGWRTLAGHVDQLRRELRAEGEEPLLAGTLWWLPGELALYCEGQPEVFCFGRAAGSRLSQYDLWQPNPLSQPEQYRGRTFVVVGDLPAELAAAFESVEPARTVLHRVRSQPIQCWPIRVCRGFTGWTKGDRHEWHFPAL